MKNRTKHVLTIVKGREKYVFRYDDASRKALLGVFGRFAASPELSFSWHDAAVMTVKAREKSPRAPHPDRVSLE